MLDRLRRFADAKSVDARIARAAVLSGGLSVGVKAAAFAKEILVAAVFGVSGQIDAYLIALMLVGIPHGIVVNAVQWTLIPEFVKAESGRGRAQSRALLRQAVALTLLVLGAALGAWIALLPWLTAHLAKAGGPAGLDTVRNCFALLCLYYFASGSLLLGYAVLQAEKRFLVNGAVPIATPVIIAVLVVITPAPAAETLALGMALGFVAELMIVERILRKSGLTLVPGPPFSGPIGRPFMANLARLALGTAALSLLPLVEQAAAVELGVGAVATLGYANKLPGLVSGLAVVAIGVAVFPYFAELLVRGDTEQCLKTLRRFAAAVCVLGAAAVTTLILFSEPIVRLFFVRGAFTEAAAVSVSFAQQAYLVQIPGALILALASRLLLAGGRTGVMLVLHVTQLLLFAAAAGVAIGSSESPAAIAFAYSVAVTLTAMLGYALASQSVVRSSGRLR